MRIFSILALTTIVSINAYGQFHHDEPNDFAFGLSISTSYHQVAVANLNTFLRAINLKEVKTGYLNLGTGLNYKYGRHFIQFVGDIDINEVTEYNDSNVGTHSYSFAVNINYG